ncbi:MAG: hypothetical protein JXA04_02195 [Gammaproteobacteria bacterium]|nr:hypothetical protein [Gammaproteobacteria bacterium]
MSAHRKTGPKRIYLALVCLYCALLGTVSAQPEDSECLFEFNKAYSIYESGMQQLETAQQYAEKNHFLEAAERYQLAIDLLQQSIDDYHKLPKAARDCSATNLSIAKNNIQLAQENLNWAKFSINGLDCLKAVNELESLCNLSSKYYYDHRDSVSAQRTISEALSMSEQLKNDGICQGEYQDLLLAQDQYAKRIADALQKRGRFDACLDSIKSAEKAEQQARKAITEKNPSQARLMWQETEKRAGEGIAKNICDGLYLKQLQNLKTYAERQLEK